MKKITAISLMLIMCVGLFTGCGKNYTAEKSTIFMLDDGKVVVTDVEEFDGKTYSEDELEDYIDETVDAYNETHEKGSVKCKKLKVDDETKKATLIMEYATAEDYVAFIGEDAFNGTLAEALAAGYSFEGEFASIDDKQKATACDYDSFKNEEGLRVAIVKQNVNVNVDGKILYASSTNTKMIDESTIEIGEGLSLLKKAMESTEDGTESVEKVVTTEAEEEGSDGAVSEADLLAESTESDEEVTFDFGGAAQDDTNAVYTYIIYK